MARYGIMKINKLIPRAMRLGSKAYLGIPLGIKLDQVKLPKQ